MKIIKLKRFEGSELYFNGGLKVEYPDGTTFRNDDATQMVLYEILSRLDEKVNKND